MRRVKLSRRRILLSLGGAASAYALGDIWAPIAADAEPLPIGKLPLFVFAYFGGGWDTLLSLDPRDHTKSNEGSAIVTAYDKVTDPVVKDVLAKTGGTGIVDKGALKLGPAIGQLGDLADELCIVRGIHMGTLTHEVGRRYFVTGRFPRGTSAVGTALSNYVAATDPSAALIPNLVLGGVESYNQGLDPKASALSVASHNDLASVLRPLNDKLRLNAKSEQAIADYHAEDHCVHQALAPSGLVDVHRASWQKARVFGDGALWSYFDFRPNPPKGGSIARLFEAFGVDPSYPQGVLSGPKGQAAAAAQALTSNLTQVVSIAPTEGLDTHSDDWAPLQATLQRTGFDAVAALVKFLKNTPDPSSIGASFWDRTTLVCFSEFARTPKLSARGGRDHHLHSACVVAGRGIRGGQVIGATDDNYSSMAVNPKTGAPDEGGVLLRPVDVHATVLEAMGLGREHLSNQDPVLISKMLAG